MKNDGFKLSRRKILAGLGAIGVGSVGAGLGTTAYFSDRETFTNNRLVAGELDLQVDWEEHYSDWSADENDDRLDDFGGDEFDEDLDGDGVDDFDVAMTKGDTENVPEGYVGFPTFDEPMVAVPDTAVDDFLDNTAIEAFPDEDGDGIQDLILTRDQISSQNPTLSPEEVEQAFHDQFADVPDDLERPVIELEDVKPGDFGEVTFSTHLHNNPGYLWLTGQLLDASENGHTEPERKDEDEKEDVVELLDAIQVAVWYDDGDNVREPEEMIHSPHDITEGDSITIDAEESLIARGSLREVLATLSEDPGIPLDADPRNEDRDCYPNSTTYYFGFAWWLPVDHANEIQTDSVTFDLGFYTEQCRHNDGTGMVEPIDLSTGTADWQVTPPEGDTQPAVVTDPHPAWDTAPCASWVDPYGNDPVDSDPPGEYVYEVDFDVEGSSLVDTLVIDTYGSDNPIEFYLDGTKIGGSGGESAFSPLRTDVDPIPHLEPGTHTLQAVVTNNPGGGGNPTGLLVCGHVE